MAFTATVDELLFETLEAFKLSLFPINQIGTEFKSATAKKDDTIKAHILGIPSTSTYNASTGFLNGAAEAETMFTDVPVTLDQMPTVPIKIDYLTQLGSKVDLGKATTNMGYALAKAVLGNILTKVTVANFTYAATAVDAANFNLDELEEVRTKLNTNGAMQMGRWGVLNSAAAQYLGTDSRVASSDFYNQTSGGPRGFRQWTGVAGFDKIWEYPDMPTNSEKLQGFFADPRAIVFASRPIDVNTPAQQFGATQVNRFNQVTDPETGLTLTAVTWEAAGTADAYMVLSILYGVSAGTQGGSANALTDKAGVRLVTP